MSAKPFAAQADGVRLAVRVTPRASRNAVEGVAMDAEGRALMKIRLAAPPVDGAANDARAIVRDALRLVVHVDTARAPSLDRSSSDENSRARV